MPIRIACGEATVDPLNRITTGVGLSSGYFYEFNGVDMYAVMAGGGWTPLGLPFTVSGKVKPTSTPDASGAYVVGASAAAPFFRTEATTLYYNAGYVDLAGANINSGLDLAIAGTQDGWMTFTSVFTASGVTTTLNGTDATVDTQIPKSLTAVAIRCISTFYTAGVLLPFPGIIKDLRFTDGTGLHGRTVCLGNGGLRYVALNQSITLPETDNYKISFDWIRQDFSGASQHKVIGSSTGTTSIAMNDTGAGNAGQITLVTPGTDVFFLLALEDVALGQTCNIEIEKAGTTFTCKVDGLLKGTQVVAGTAALVIEWFYRASTNSIVATSAMGNISIENSTTGDTWFYALENEA